MDVSDKWVSAGFPGGFTDKAIAAAPITVIFTVDGGESWVGMCPAVPQVGERVASPGGTRLPVSAVDYRRISAATNPHQYGIFVLLDAR